MMLWLQLLYGINRPYILELAIGLTRNESLFSRNIFLTFSKKCNKSTEPRLRSVDVDWFREIRVGFAERRPR